ncbi:Uncharacterized protein APZ42_013377 [Daphnia magna]|uniref:Uncharacterized protein n=1 Tax=Daphnia magna TaxID=35525 RepID=A0A162QXB7_9CRUS|nr:Uncharacterized protein APZ42_013377 [Daphnia magna]
MAIGSTRHIFIPNEIPATFHMPVIVLTVLIDLQASRRQMGRPGIRERLINLTASRRKPKN